MLLHSPPLAMGWLSLLSAVRKESSLPGNLRELLIMQIASLNRAPYEWDQHHALALQEGVTEAQLAALACWRANGESFTELQRAALEYCEAMTTKVTVPQDVFDRLCVRVSLRQLIDITVTVATYNMVSRVLQALEIRSDDTEELSNGA
jgi:AhpD family alkylhydroperoxidase